MQGFFPRTIAWNSNKFNSKSPHYPKIELCKTIRICNRVRMRVCVCIESIKVSNVRVFSALGRSALTTVRSALRVMFRIHRHVSRSRRRRRYNFINS